MHVRVRFSGYPDATLVVKSKITKIEEFRNSIKEKFNVEPNMQLLFYGGKLLENGYTFHDYSIKLNDVIQLMVKPKQLSVVIDKKKDITQVKRKIYEDTVSKFYKIGDLVDLKLKEQGSWVEGEITRIVINPNTGYDDGDNDLLGIEINPSDINDINSGEDDPNILYEINLEYEESQCVTFCKLSDIRPRARTVINCKDVRVGQIIMINHNIDDPTEVGDWYDFKVEEIKQIKKYYTFYGELYIGPESMPAKTIVKVKDKIFAIEKPVLLSERTEKYNKYILTTPPTRSRSLMCKNCRDDPKIPCEKCGCCVCSGKNSPEKILLCDECNFGYHLKCLVPRLTSVPVDDWYCPSCKRDPDDVVAPGGSKQTRKTDTTKKTRDWGRGMACVGKTKSCQMPMDHFGPIPGIDVGMVWRYRMQISETGVHRPSVSGIHGRDAIGAFSIVLSGGYEDDEDRGNEFTYTGCGGRDLSGNKRTAEQSSHQKFIRENRALARNCVAAKVCEEGGNAGENWRKGKPVRVLRSYKMRKMFPKYAPAEGIRYDGIYKVVMYYPEIGKSGFRVYKYLLRRDDPSPAPWESKAKKYSIIYPDGYLEAEAQKKELKETRKSEQQSPSPETINKAMAKAGSSGIKRAGTVENGTKIKRCRVDSDDSDESDDIPIVYLNKKSNCIVSSEEESSPNNTSSGSGETLAGSSKGKGKGKQKNQVNNNESTKPKMSSCYTSNNTTDSQGSISSADTKSVIISQKLSASLMKIIESDELNTTAWMELIDKCGRQSLSEFIEKVLEAFRCIICQGIVISPVTTYCRHNFCLPCLKRAFKSMEATCPHCRQNLADFDIQINETLRQALRIILPGYDGKL